MKHPKVKEEHEVREHITKLITLIRLLNDHIRHTKKENGITDLKLCLNMTSSSLKNQMKLQE